MSSPESINNSSEEQTKNEKKHTEQGLKIGNCVVPHWVVVAVLAVLLLYIIYESGIIGCLCAKNKVIGMTDRSVLRIPDDTTGNVMEKVFNY